MNNKPQIRNLRFAIGGLALSVGLFAISCNQPNSGAASHPSHADQVAANTQATKSEYKADMPEPPLVPKPITRTEPAKVTVDLISIEKPMEIDKGVEYSSAWTFNGTIPGPMIRVMEGDQVEVNFKNDPSSTMAHNVDFHSVTGPGGGAEASLTSPGKQSKFSFRALKPGFYIYHCAAPPVGTHIANGMYGMMVVEPKGGLPPVDKEFYIVQSEFYMNGKNGVEGSYSFDLDKAIAENPDYVVFDGHSNLLTGKNALQAKVGDKVRIYFGNAGPNLTSSFHTIGIIFDDVHVEGGTLLNHDVQTTTVPAGGATMVEFTCDVPGTYNIVDHAIFRTFNKGALAQIKVTGDENKDIFSGKLGEEPYNP